MIPEHKKHTLNSIVKDLGTIDGMVAVVLGGSYCIGMANENSDLDIGLYYREGSPFDIDAVRTVVRKYSIEESPTVTDFYQWGRWVNGGAWINTAVGEVDFLYKNVDQIRTVIEKAKNGVWENDYAQQPPFGFSSVIFLAETHYCMPLYDPNGVIDDLKDQVKTYPHRLKQSVVQQSLWSAEFTLWQADKFAKKRDVYNAAGCFTRATKNIVDAIFALNEQYPIGDKYAVQMAERMPSCPGQLSQQIEDVLSLRKETLATNAQRLRSLFEEVVALAGKLYSPYFQL
ncbi:MAG TPA: DUF4037 domain-containing protein [Cyclobacteriaceae bacterium]|nr:DUF4037 domain-containing protein [Cyclobacteriaceae bacterium]